MNRFTLTVEGEPFIESPSIAQIRAAVDRMTPRGGPGFIILEEPGSDYAQAAGGDGVFTAEWRENVKDGFRHWKAGLPGQPTVGEVAIPANGFEITVRQNERLAASDVTAILAAYLSGLGRPKQFAWRDMTEMFT